MIPAVILAGGGSTRMGRPKALLPIPSTNEVFLARLVRTLRAAGVEDVLVVGGGDSAEIGRYMARALPEVRLLVNPEPAEGQLSSLLVALSAVDRPGVRALLVALVDHPLVAPATVRSVIETYKRTGAAIVRPVRGGRHGHPALFDRRTFDALRRATPALGAKEVVQKYSGEIVEVEVTDEGVFTDIDTPADYERAFGVKLDLNERI
ncbi:MAG: nucleotidyltransferase family protein [Acidobacteria bacterium]|nr:nucleotidyltransferase family protein [Acidobacteriota bacterium]